MSHYRDKVALAQKQAEEKAEVTRRMNAAFSTMGKVTFWKEKPEDYTLMRVPGDKPGCPFWMSSLSRANVRFKRVHKTRRRGVTFYVKALGGKGTDARKGFYKTRAHRLIRRGEGGSIHNQLGDL